ELVARALHYSGERCDKAFIKVNCSALPESLLESELFGHVKGAFTGSVKDREGRFEAADGGTILLDEIGDISPLIQLKLLRVLQEKEFERVGESRPRQVDVRIIASTNTDLKAKVKSGEFREDLYYRLKVMEITLPALRDRLEDLPLLVEHFCQTFRKRFKKEIEGVSGEVLNQFMNYSWPGNVRELEHVLEHGFVLCNGQSITLAHLPKELREHDGMPHTPPQRQSSGKSYDARTVLNALEQTRWNRTKAAQLLGVNRRTIHRKIKKYHLDKESKV
ncbi:MAG: sigma-54 interaction domain-containing protein, partial [Desulfobacterales bacterium]